jgi:hypothetical protein
MSHKLKIKQVDLSGVQQDNSKTKFLVIDANGNLSWNDSPVSPGSVSYTNSNPIESQIGGIQVGQTFLNKTMQEMWDMLLYPYLAPAFTMFTMTGTNPLEVGQALPATLSFSWESIRDANVQPGSVHIFDPVSTIISGQNSDSSVSPVTSYTYPVPVKLTTFGSYSWTVQGQNTQGTTYSAALARAWWWRVYWGESSSAALPNEAFIESLNNSSLRSNRSGSYQFAANNYKYLALPAAYGIPSSIFFQGLPFALADSSDGYNLGGGNITYTQVSITNSYGITSTYNVFRSKNPLVGAVTMSVS